MDWKGLIVPSNQLFGTNYGILDSEKRSFVELTSTLFQKYIESTFLQEKY